MCGFFSGRQGLHGLNLLLLSQHIIRTLLVSILCPYTTVNSVAPSKCTQIANLSFFSVNSSLYSLYLQSSLSFAIPLRQEANVQNYRSSSPSLMFPLAIRNVLDVVAYKPKASQLIHLLSALFFDVLEEQRGISCKALTTFM